MIDYKKFNCSEFSSICPETLRGIIGNQSLSGQLGTKQLSADYDQF